eukprot:Em0018g559a
MLISKNNEMTGWLESLWIESRLGHKIIIISVICHVLVGKLKGNRTPLHCAVAYGHLEVIKLLVQNGGALYLETWCGDTALQIVMKECNDLHSQSSQDILQYLRGVYDSVGVANKGLVYILLARQPATSEELSFEEGELLKVLERGGGSRGMH